MDFSRMSFDDLMEHFQEKQNDIKLLHSKLESLVEVYKAELKAAFGVTDGEPADIFSLVKMVRRMMNAPKSNIIR